MCPYFGLFSLAFFQIPPVMLFLILTRGAKEAGFSGLLKRKIYICVCVYISFGVPLKIQVY